jgi:hypothetical protein
MIFIRLLFNLLKNLGYPRSVVDYFRLFFILTC